MQNCTYSIANALELLQPCTKPKAKYQHHTTDLILTEYFHFHPPLKLIFFPSALKKGGLYRGAYPSPSHNEYPTRVQQPMIAKQDSHHKPNWFNNFESEFLTPHFVCKVLRDQIDDLAQDCSNSSANALELLQSYTKPLRWYIACLWVRYVTLFEVCQKPVIVMLQAKLCFTSPHYSWKDYHLCLDVNHIMR